MFLIVNHKANLDYEEILEYERKIRKLNIIIIPTMCYLPIFLKGDYGLASQDISSYNESLTGEITGKQLRSLNVRYSLVGHSDLRNYKNITIDEIYKKIDNCYENNIIPIYCLGYKEYVNVDEIIYEIDTVLNYINEQNIIFAYEPKENIGASTIDLNLAKENTSKIKEYINDLDKDNIKLVYGGGVNLNNIDEIKEFDIDGILLSSESLNVDNLLKIYDIVNKI